MIDKISVSIRDVTKIFVSHTGETKALAETSLHVREGEFVSLLGPSGCGKSTLLRLLASLDRPSTGEVELTLNNAGRSPVSVVFQDYSIFPWKTVLGNVAFGLRLAGKKRPEAERIAREHIVRMNLAGFENAYPGQLSGGMKQRVSLARALALDPDLLLLDEPFAALDPQMRQILQEDLLRQWENGDVRTAISVTHDLDEAILLGDRVALMSARPGRIKRIFDVPFGRPRSPDIRYSQKFSEIRQEIWASLRDEVRPAGPDTAPIKHSEPI
jgi:NitT/TauT family transport system ATP-binding protein